MAPRLAMRVAVAMMCLGVCPFLLGLAWATSSLSYARHHPGAAGAPSAFLLTAVLAGAYLFALVVSGCGVLMSFRAKGRLAETVTGIGAARTVVGVVLALPVFLYGAILFSSR